MQIASTVCKLIIAAPGADIVTFCCPAYSAYNLYPANVAGPSEPRSKSDWPKFVEFLTYQGLVLRP